ncbi:MAG: transporter substrate-binding domain-containing protein [Sulfurimonas sp.]
MVALARYFLLLFLPLSIFANVTNPVYTSEEKGWMKSHPIVKFTGDPNWLPYEAFNESGEYIGIVADILKIVEKKTDIKFEKYETSSWDESVQALKDAHVDMLTETTDSTLKDNFLFTDSFLSNPIVVIMRHGSPYVDKLKQLKNKKIVIISGYGYVDKITKKYPDYKFYYVKNIQDGLEAISTGKYDAMLSSMALGSYYISSMQLSTINVVGKTEFTTQIGFAITPKYKILVGILNKVFKTIDEPTKQQILSKCVTQGYVERVDYTLIIVIGVVSLLIIFLTLFWSFRLKSEIARRIILEDENAKMLEQQAKYAALGEMMDAVAHQWKQPLNAITMLTDLLYMNYQEKTLGDAYMKEYQEDMDIQVGHLLTTLSEFRSFLRPDKEAENFNLLENINSVLVLIKDEMLNNQIDIVVDCDKSITINVIKNEFKHIILNIINNAKDAFVENNIKERKINIFVTQTVDEVKLEIGDNAGGIPENILPNIFQANITSKPEGKGTGIGLYMSKQIADKMSAKLTAKNVDSGALFRLSIPKDKQIVS